jgi:hypothetical protein
MARRSTKLLRFENSLYKYDKEKQNWAVEFINLMKAETNIDLFEKGTYATCKRMSQKVNPILLRKGFSNSWDQLPFINYKENNIYKNKFYFELFVNTYVNSVLKTLYSFLEKIEIKEINNIYYIKIYYYTSKNILKKDLLINPKRKKRFLTESNLTDLQYNPFFIEDTNTRSFEIDRVKLASHFEKYLSSFYNYDIKITLVQQNNIGGSANLISSFLAREIENSNANFKRALRETLKEISDKSIIRGIRINCSGRLGKAPMAKTEWFKYGQIPLSKINANLDYSSNLSVTKYGSIGNKVWIYYY